MLPVRSAHGTPTHGTQPGGGEMRPHVWDWVPRTSGSVPSPPAPRDVLKPCFLFFFFMEKLLFIV